MNDQVATILRSVLKVGGAALVTKGYTDSAGLEAGIGALITIIGLAWSFFHHKPKVNS